MSSHEQFPLVGLYVTIGLIIISFFIATLCPAYFIIRNIFFEETSAEIDHSTESTNINSVNSSSPKSDSPSINSPSIQSSRTSHKTSKNSKSIDIPILTKTFLLLSITSSLLWFSIQIINYSYLWTVFTTDTNWCHYMYILPTIFYFTERVSTIVFFTLTAYDTFKNTAGEYKKSTIYCIVGFGIFIGLFIIIPTVYIQSTQFEFEIIKYQNFGGSCKLETSSGGVIFLLFSVGIFMEIIFNIIAVYLLLSKLCALIVSAHKINQTEMEMNAQYEQTNSKDNLTHFHSKTSQHNAIIVLMSKLVMLLIITVIISQLAVIISSIRHLLVIGFGLGILVHMYCLYFTFRFSNKHFTKYCYGNQCTKCCFPCIKTMALTWHDNSKLCGCCSCCCYCLLSSENKNKQSQIYNLAKAEIALIVSK